MEVRAFERYIPLYSLNTITFLPLLLKLFDLPLPPEVCDFLKEFNLL